MLRRSPAWFADQLPPTQIHHGAGVAKVAYEHARSLLALAATADVAGRVEFFGYPNGRHRTRTLAGAIERAEAFLMEQVGGRQT